MAKNQIEVRYGKTKNLGNYETERLDVSISLNTTNEENIMELIEITRKKLKKYVNNKLKIKE